MSNKEPKVSVIMSVYNTPEDFLREAIESILDQTLDDFEFIIVDDGSFKECIEIIRGYRDDRIKLIVNGENRGLTKSLNSGVEHARGKYIARMDADDYSYPKRLEAQYYYMEKHPEIAVLGCWVKEGETVKKCFGNVTSEWRYARMLLDNVGIYHPTAFIRHSFLKMHNLKYDESILKSQDFELWTRCLSYGQMYVFPEVLFNYRIHDMQITQMNSEAQNMYNYIARRRLLDKLSVELTDIEEEQFRYINERRLNAFAIDALFNKILQANREKKVFNPQILKYELRTKWILYLLQTKGTGKKEFLSLKYFFRLFDVRYYIYELRIWLRREGLI